MAERGSRPARAPRRTRVDTEHAAFDPQPMEASVQNSAQQLSLRVREQAARAVVERRFSLDGIVAAYGNLYNQALAAVDAGGAKRHHYV